MGVSLDNLLVQPAATGSFEGTSGSVTLPQGTEAGSHVLIVAGIGGDGTNLTSLDTPSGFTDISGTGTGNDYARLYAYIKPSASAGETSWTLALSSGSRRVLWSVYECTGLDLDWPAKAYVWSGQNSGISTTVTSVTPNNFGQSESFSAVSLTTFMAAATDSTIPTIGSYTDGFNELVTLTASNASRGFRLSAAGRQELNIATPNPTATISPSSYAAALLLTFTGVDSPHAPTLSAVCGAEIGTPTSLTSTSPAGGDGSIAPFDTTSGTPDITTTHVRSGSYALEQAGTDQVMWGQKTSPAQGTLGTTNDVIATWTQRLHVYAESWTENRELASIEAGSSSNSVVLRYVHASQKLGLKVGTGSEVLSDATVSSGQWIGVDLLYDPRTTTHTCAWAVDYNANVADTTDSVLQTAASNTGMTAAGVTVVRFGATAANSTTVWYDDLVGSKWRKTFPLGDIRVVPLKVDPAGTPSVSGSSANFRTWTSNGTLATWTASGTRTALDDIPPTIGAASDGLTQIANASTEYVEVPMETFALGPDYAGIGGRWYWAGWAASANPATFRFRPADGSGTFGVLGDTIDAGFDDTALVWMCKIHNQSATQASFYQMTQARVDALAAQFGFGTDMNPDAGVHAVLFELAIQPAIVYGTTEAEGGAFKIYLRQDRFTGAHVSYLVTTPAGTRGATAYGTIDGTPWSQTVGANTTYERTVNATSVAGVTEGPGLTPDPA